MDIADPDELVTFAVDPAGGASSFFTGYNNPTVIGLSHQAQRESDPAKRAGAVLEDPAHRRAGRVPWASSTTRRSGAAYTSKLHGFFVQPLGNYHLEDAWLG